MFVFVFLVLVPEYEIKEKNYCIEVKNHSYCHSYLWVWWVFHMYMKNVKNESVAIFFRVGISHDMEDLRRSSESRLDLPD